jgi:hypothetical protein
MLVILYIKVIFKRNMILVCKIFLICTASACNIVFIFNSNKNSELVLDIYCMKNLIAITGEIPRKRAFEERISVCPLINKSHTRLINQRRPNTSYLVINYAKKLGLNPLYQLSVGPILESTRASLSATVVLALSCRLNLTDR